MSSNVCDCLQIVCEKIVFVFFFTLCSYRFFVVRNGFETWARVAQSLTLSVSQHHPTHCLYIYTLKMCANSSEKSNSTSNKNSKQETETRLGDTQVKMKFGL